MSDHLEGEERKKKAREHFIDNQVARLSKPLANTTKTKEEIREEEEKKFDEKDEPDKERIYEKFIGDQEWGYARNFKL